MQAFPSLVQKELITDLKQCVCRNGRAGQGQWEPSLWPYQCLMIKEASGFTKLLVIAV